MIYYPLNLLRTVPRAHTTAYGAGDKNMHKKRWAALLAAAASQSAGLSGEYLSALAGDERRLPGRDELRRYCGRFLALLTAAAVAAMIGAIIAGSYPAGT